MRKGYRLGIDLGGTRVKAALVDEAGRILERHSIETPRDPRRLVEAAALSVAGWKRRKALGTGVGVAGDVDAAGGVVRFSPNLGWRRVALGSLFRRAGFPGPVVFENDATAAAWGAFHTELKGRSRHLVVLTLGTGVGGGLILDGRVHRGVSGTAGEIGHMVVETDGAACVCGGHGCLEAYLGGAAMVRWAVERYREVEVTPHPSPPPRLGRPGKPERPPEELTPRILAERARAGDPVARATWLRASRALGSALASLVNLLNPDTILLTGGVAQAAPLFLPGARREMARRAFRTPVRAVRLMASGRSEDLGVIGAALLVP